MGTAVIGLSLTFTNLAEVQTKKRGREELEEKKRVNKTHTQKPYTQLGPAPGQKGMRKDTKRSCSHPRAQLDFSTKSDGRERLNVNTRSCLY